MTTYSGISQGAFDLIVAEEVSSQAAYNAHYQRPERPGGQSGITVGIGYDCGYATPDRIRADWGGHIPADMVGALVRVAGLKGADAQAALAVVRPQVLVPWQAAIEVFANTDVPRWATTVRKGLPNCDRLSPDCFGALVSLAYNRGASFALSGERYAEMRAIKAHMAGLDFAKIPSEFRSMKRLWTTPSVRGVASRRDHEAALFERGLRDPTRVVLPTPSAEPPAKQVTPNQPPKTSNKAGTGAVIAGTAGTVAVGVQQGWSLVDIGLTAFIAAGFITAVVLLIKKVRS